jgi:hypothetical protein
MASDLHHVRVASVETLVTVVTVVIDSAGRLPQNDVGAGVGEGGRIRAAPEAGENPARPRHCNGNETPLDATGRA